MKKSYLFMLGALALSLAACSDEEPNLRKTDGEAIDFRPAMTTSRASEVTNANLTSIYVTALDGSSTADYFANLNFVKGSTGFFTSSPVYYWPGDNRELTFYAYDRRRMNLAQTLTSPPTRKR